MILNYYASVVVTITLLSVNCKALQLKYGQRELIRLTTVINVVYLITDIFKFLKPIRTSLLIIFYFCYIFNI